jgi:hypothetical protein
VVGGSGYLVPSGQTIWVSDGVIERAATVAVTPLVRDLAAWSLPKPTGPPFPQVATEDATGADLSRNLFLEGGLRGWFRRHQVRSRVSRLKASLSQIEDALRGQHLDRIVSLYVLGSALWVPTPNDIDLVVVVADDRSLELLQPLDGPHVPLHIRVVGLPNLERAVAAGAVGDVRLHYECITLYATAVLLAGHDLFAGCSVSSQNLAAWLEYFRLDLLGDFQLSTDDRVASSPKRERWRQQLARLEARIR